MATFKLTVCKIKFYNNSAVDAEFSDYTKSSFNLITGKEKKTDNTIAYSSVAVDGTLVSLDVHKRIGRHNNIKVRLKLIKDAKGTGTLNVTLLKKVFLKREVKLTVNESLNMQKYYVFGVSPLYQNENNSIVYYVDLDIYSWDRLMDIKKYSKSYIAKKLSGILDDFKAGYANAPTDGFKTSDMRTLVGNKKIKDNPLTYEPEELTFSFLEQCDETEYDFILRTANRCGEFFYFENDTLNLGLTRITQQVKDKTEEVVTSITDHSSIEPLSCENYGEDELKTFADEFVDEKPSLCKPACDDKFIFGTPKTASSDSADGWMGLNPPAWSRYLSRTFQYDNIMSWSIDTAASEISAKSTAEAMSKSFNTAVSSFNVAYTPDESFFSNVRKAECIVANNQYRITFDGMQKSIKLGDLVECKSIDESGKFVVVDVHSICEFISKDDGKGKITTDTVQKMEVTVVPVFKDEKNIEYCYPLPMDASQDYAVRPEARVVPKSDTRCDSPLRLRTATVINREDPFRLNRVRVKYDDGNNSSSDEWITVLTPFASGEKGISCKLLNGDKVLVLQNIECEGKVKSFVIGSYFDEGHTPPYGQRKFTTIIRSKNGQYIGFEESSNIGGVITSFFPGVGLLKSIFPPLSAKLTRKTEDEDELLALGGIEISDNYGLFTIGASSTSRKVTISSPFGTVGIDAAMGITISAPNGNVKIVGKNVDIVAGNNLTLKSGANIDSGLLTTRSLTADGLLSELNTLVDTVKGLFDVPALRFVVELLFKPVAGTLKVHSGRYLMVEAGNNEASLPKGMFNKIIDKRQRDFFDGNGNLGAVMTIADNINKWIACFKKYVNTCFDAYKSASEMRASLLSDILKGYYEKDKDVNIKAADANSIIDDWITGAADLNKDGVEAKLQAKPGGNNNVDPDHAKIITAVNSLRTSYKDMWENNDFKKDCFNDLAINKDSLFGKAKNIRIGGPTNDAKLFKNTTAEAIKRDMFNSGDEIKTQLRFGVVEIIGTWFSYTGTVNQDDQVWNNLIDGIKPKNEDYIKTGLANFGIDILENLIPIESLNTFCWSNEAKGKILMSQDKGSTLSIKGQAIQEDITGYTIVKEAMRNATL